jgi:undecaprenyl diphosphate synthase
MGLVSRKKKTPEATVLPRHIAIIMDGNGRWAKKRGLPRSFGHSAGAERFRDISEYCGELGIEQLSVFAFSTENWKRPPEEVAGIMDLLRKYLKESCEKLAVKNARLRFLGDLSLLPGDIRDLIAKISEICTNCTGIIVNVCINYGGKSDILSAAKELARRCKSGEINLEAFGEADFAKLLYTKGLPDPDLLIRTGGEKRISNFMLWQSAYSELFFTDILWPDFGRAQLDDAILYFSHRNRRFGAVDGA